MFKEFKPALKFLLVFLALYVSGNVVYGLFIEYYHHQPDPVTSALAFQSRWVLDLIGYTVVAVENTQGPTVFLRDGTRTVLNIYEGCNGLNVMIVFLAFIVAFGGNPKKMSWFIPAGIVIIHLANIVRIVLLYFVAISYQHYFYYVHKYIFTAVLYIITFVLWYIWVSRLNGKSK